MRPIEKRGRENEMSEKMGIKRFKMKEGDRGGGQTSGNDAARRVVKAKEGAQGGPGCEGGPTWRGVR